MSKWSDLYEKEILEEKNIQNYIENKLKNKKKLIKIIKKYSNKKILELGAGTGVLALYLSTLGRYVTALDVDRDMINLSKKYFLNKFENNKINYVCKNILDFKPTKKYDVCYSIGILEHYSDEDIIRLLKKQKEISRYIIFGIPTKYFDEDKKMYGNERYLPIKYWRKLIKKSGLKIVKETSYGYLSLFKSLLNVRKWFKPNPVHIFVVK